MPMPASRTSPTRFRNLAAVSPPTTAPTPWNDIRTPMNDGGRWRLSLLTAKMRVSSNPIASRAAPTPTLSWRKTGVRAMWVRPADSSRRKRCSFGAGGGSRKRSATRVAAEARNVPASTSATTGPPKTA